MASSSPLRQPSAATSPVGGGLDAALFRQLVWRGNQGSPGAILHAPGRWTTDSPRPEEPKNDFCVSQISDSLRLIQRAPGQSFMPWGARLSHIASEFPDSRQSEKTIPTPCGVGIFAYVTIPGVSQSEYTYPGAKRGPAPCWAPSLVTFLAKQESDTSRPTLTFSRFPRGSCSGPRIFRSAR